jgi:ABC-type molybdenum transport system ATPase subunit/photorepair protein PhrA
MEEEKYRSFADSFHENGVGEYIKLPQIVVMGDTSSGKSSLLSMISNIPFPSSDKLTTRCPTRLHMDKASVKEYKVSITWHSSSAYRDNGFQTRYLSSID